MLNRFCLTQNLRALMQPGQLPSEIHGLLPDFEKTFNSGEQGTLLNDSLGLEELSEQDLDNESWTIRSTTSLTGEPGRLLQAWLKNAGKPVAPRPLVSFRSELRLAGQTFEPSTTPNFGNSKIVFVLDERKPTEWSAGCITKIISHTLSSMEKITFVLVDVYAPVSGEDARVDYFRRFPIGGGGLFYQRVQRKVLLPSDKILGHFLYTGQNWKAIKELHFHALPLVRVRNLNLN